MDGLQSYQYQELKWLITFKTPNGFAKKTMFNYIVIGDATWLARKRIIARATLTCESDYIPIHAKLIKQ